MEAVFSKATAEGFKAIFREADVDNSKSLSLAELRSVMLKHGYKGDEDALQKFFQQADTSGDNVISLDEYMNAMQNAPETLHTAAVMRMNFLRYDRDGNGSIDRSELATVLKEMGRSFDKDEVQRMMDIADSDKSGALDYEEFIRLVLDTLHK